MCEPATLTLAAGMMMAAGSVATGVMGAQAASVNATAYEEQAQLRIQKGEFDAVQAQNRFRRVFGQAVAGAAASGVDPQSFGDVFADMTMESELEQKAIRFGAANEARNLRFQAQGQEIAGDAAIIGGVFGGAGQALNAGAKSYDMRQNGKGYGSVGFNRNLT
jgi:hypothetical protein